tara:strand:+ start:537 stop:1016 length:480 start_codon:yes stop_codon:yes gene_type:complete
MGKKRVADVKYTPVLSKHLLEGAFSQCMHQVLESLHACRQHKHTKMTLDEHVKALMNIAGAEIATALMITEDRHAATMVVKHALWVKRARTCYNKLIAFDAEDSTNMAGPLREITQWIQDSHLILHEDTPNEARAYVAAKGCTAEETLDGVENRVPGVQ